MGYDLARGSEMVEKSTGRSIWGVDWTEKAPRLWEEFAYCGGAKFSKISTTMNRSEMTDVSAHGM